MTGLPATGEGRYDDGGCPLAHGREPSIDPVRWQASGEIHLLVQAVAQRDGDDRQPVAAPPTPLGVRVWKP
jgi:hypothetical protein